jgi:hypothetical protein
MCHDLFLDYSLNLFFSSKIKIKNKIKVGNVEKIDKGEFQKCIKIKLQF